MMSGLVKQNNCKGFGIGKAKGSNLTEFNFSKAQKQSQFFLKKYQTKAIPKPELLTYN